MKILRSMVALMGIALLLIGCAVQSADPTGPEIVGARKIVALVPPGQSTRAMRAAAATQGYRPLEETRLRALGLRMLSYEMPEGVTGAEAIAALEGAVPTSTVGINHAYRLQQQTGGAGSLDYAGEMMGWPAGGCRAQSRIGVIDTGVDTRAPALAGTRIVSRNFFEGTAGPATHGTEVATVLTGPNRLRGALIYSANVFGQDEALGLVAGADALVEALDWLAAQDVRFVNLALAGPYNKLLDLAVERATARGLILVAAVGNEGPTAGPLFPAGFDNVIAVTAIDVDRRIYRNAVRGPHVDIAAPGVDVLVQSGSSARFVTGTSIATPFVTARLAADPSLTAARSADQVRSRLAQTSTELGARGRDPLYGYGLARAEGICG